MKNDARLAECILKASGLDVYPYIYFNISKLWNDTVLEKVSFKQGCCGSSAMAGQIWRMTHIYFGHILLEINGGQFIGKGGPFIDLASKMEIHLYRNPPINLFGFVLATTPLI